MGFIVLIVIAIVVAVAISSGGSAHVRGPRITKYGRFHRW